MASLLLAEAGTSTSPGAEVVGGAPVSGTTPGATSACTQTKESLRPMGSLPAPGAMPRGSTMAAIAARGRLIAGVDQGKYRVGYRNPITGELEGSDIDIVRQIAAAIFGDPNRVQFVALDIADRVGAIERGQVDVVVNTFTVTCDRQQKVEFSTAYLAASQRVLVPINSPVTEIEGLTGAQVCTSSGSTTEQVLRALPIGLHVVSLPGIPDCMVEFQRGHVAAVSSDDVILAGLTAQDPQTKVIGRPLAHALYAMGMKRDATDFVRFVNAVLERARSDGSLARSDQHWLGVLNPVPQPAPARYRD
ncbi:MAG: glutamate ABC transporter substrate-binding protein [Pseudonocardiales bacterium]|nr:glutamate ABC transporter substrate-binding protein [Pseudonocardiales bacterium]